MAIDEGRLPPGWDAGLVVERAADGAIRRIVADRDGVGAVLEVGPEGTVLRETRVYRWEPAEGSEPGLELFRRAVSGGCSFCGRGPDEVGRLIAGPTANICDACVEACLDIVDADGEAEEEG